MSSNLFTDTSDDELSVGDYSFPGTPRSFSPAPSVPNCPIVTHAPNQQAQSWSYRNMDPIPSPVTTLQDLDNRTMALLGNYLTLQDRVDLIEARHEMGICKWKITTFVAVAVAVVACVAAYLRG